ncbi:hypothetical protein F4809DRAFT_638060 [Biscogniauxia mediterranea]|nr:hypothetical protein F4809DRAFT_638060 [Biscogniauxia mediterranea]
MSKIRTSYSLVIIAMRFALASKHQRTSCTFHNIAITLSARTFNHYRRHSTTTTTTIIIIINHPIFYPSNNNKNMDITRALRAIKGIFTTIWDLILMALWAMLILGLILAGIGALQRILITFLGLVPFLLLFMLLFVISVLMEPRREE